MITIRYVQTTNGLQNPAYRFVVNYLKKDNPIFWIILFSLHFIKAKYYWTNEKSLKIVFLISSHSELIMLKKTESLTLPVEVTWYFRNMPSSVAPIFKMAFLDCRFNTSVFNSTLFTLSTSNANCNSKYLQALFNPVPWCFGCIHVQPI